MPPVCAVGAAQLQLLLLLIAAAGFLLLTTASLEPAASASPAQQQQQQSPPATPATGGQLQDEAAQHQEAFLGKDEAPQFSAQPPEEAKRKLVQLLHKIDTNKDGAISVAEMENWVRHIALRDRIRMAERRMLSLKEAANSENMAAPLSFEEYERAMGRELPAGLQLSSLASHLAKSRLRWAKADANGDGQLSGPELADFLRPEESPRMRDIVVLEALNNTDSNRDGRVDMGEYLRDLYPGYDRDRREGKHLPDWVAREEAHFKEKLDLDKDGSLDASEVYRLAVPDSSDHAKAETQYLFDEADTNGDKFLTEEEVLKQWGAFVGHQATNFGAFEHQEL